MADSSISTVANAGVAIGNSTLEIIGGGKSSYDAANRLNQAEKIPAGTATPTALSSYVANGLNQRVIMTTGTTAPVTTSLLAYDEAGHLLGHYVNVAKVTDATETVWLGNMPVAIVKPANTFYIHTDPINSGTNFSYILRFRGQFADQEPGLRYNYARDYDPSVGRYVESDPIGLKGDVNTAASKKAFCSRNGTSSLAVRRNTISRLGLARPVST